MLTLLVCRSQTHIRIRARVLKLISRSQLRHRLLCDGSPVEWGKNPNDLRIDWLDLSRYGLMTQNDPSRSVPRHIHPWIEWSRNNWGATKRRMIGWAFSESGWLWMHKRSEYQMAFFRLSASCGIRIDHFISGQSLPSYATWTSSNREFALLNISSHGSSAEFPSWTILSNITGQIEVGLLQINI